MLRTLTSALLLSAILGSGCHQSQQASQDHVRKNAEIAKALRFTYDSLAPLEYRQVQTGGVFHPHIRGTWKARGYGFVFEVGETDYHWYSETADFCWEHTLDEPLEMMFAVERSSGRCYFKPYPTESAVILEPLAELPVRFREPSATGAMATLSCIDQTMTELYPFFQQRGFNWQQKMAAAQSAVTDHTTEAELFGIVELLFEGLGDGHTSVIAEIDGERRETPGAMSSIRRALEADYARQDDAVERKEYFGEWSQRLFVGIKDELLHGEARTAFEENIIWGKINPQVGYLLVRDMARFGDDDGDLVQALRRLHQQLESTFASFVGCEAVIIDVSFNMGGFHSFALAFASHFADQERYALCKYPKGHPDLLQKFNVVPYCDRRGNVKTFTKPVYVVTTDATVSAGEEFVLAARAFPHVTIVGTATQGMLSDILEKPLPNGWTLGMSNEIFLDHRGECFEAVGIPVDLEKPIFDVDNIREIGHARAILELADEIVMGSSAD